MWDIIYNFFHPNLEGYTNFSFSESQQRMLPIMVFGIFLGVFLASFYTLYIRSVLGEFVRKLNDGKIYTEEEAKTVEELGFGKNIFVRRALKNPYSLGKIVRSAENRFYLPEEDKYKAEMRFGKHKTEWHTVLFALLGILICELVVFAALPEILSLLDRVFSMFTVKGNTVIH